MTEQPFFPQTNKNKRKEKKNYKKRKICFDLFGTASASAALLLFMAAMWDVAYATIF